MFCGDRNDHKAHGWNSLRFGAQYCIGRPGHDELYRVKEPAPSVESTVSLDELAALARAHPLEPTVDDEGVELQGSPWCPGCGATRPCVVARLISMLRSPLIRCAECNFSQRHQRDDTPEHECPEGPRTARLYTVGDEQRMLTPDQVEEKWAEELADLPHEYLDDEGRQVG